MGFNERRINVMRRDFLNCIFIRDSVHRSLPALRSPAHDKMTRTRVSERSLSAA
jgi:hypothetical protein